MHTGRAMVVLVLLLVPASLAQTAVTPANFLVYHALGGPEPDPDATARAQPPWNVSRLPATFVDGTRADPAPENAPASSVAHFRELQRLVSARDATGAKLAIRLDGDVRTGALGIRADVERANDSLDAIDLSFVLFEHKRAAYVARLVLPPEPHDLSSGSARVAREVQLDAAWDLDHLGVVAIARKGDEVLQSATWMPRWDAPTEQVAKAVLVEHETASWCDPCKPVDEALALLWTQRGMAGALLPDATPAYLRAPGVGLYAGLALGALAAALVLRREKR